MNHFTDYILMESRLKERKNEYETRIEVTRALFMYKILLLREIHLYDSLYDLYILIGSMMYYFFKTKVNEMLIMSIYNCSVISYSYYKDSIYLDREWFNTIYNVDFDFIESKSIVYYLLRLVTLLDRSQNSASYNTGLFYTTFYTEPTEEIIYKEKRILISKLLDIVNRINSTDEHYILIRISFLFFKDDSEMFDL